MKEEVSYLIKIANGNSNPNESTDYNIFYLFSFKPVPVGGVKKFVKQ